MSSNEAVILVVTSILVLGLILSSTSRAYVYASMGPMACGPTVSKGGSVVPNHITCCATETNEQTGTQTTWCVDCTVQAGATVCGNRYQYQASNPNPSTNPNPTAGNNIGAPIAGITTGNNTGTPLPPGSIIKVSPGTINPAPPSGNNTIANEGSGIFSPCEPGFCHPCPLGVARLCPNATNLSNNPGSPLPPGSIFKVPPGTTNGSPTGNSTGTPPH